MVAVVVGDVSAGVVVMFVLVEAVMLVEVLVGICNGRGR